MLCEENFGRILPAYVLRLTYKVDERFWNGLAHELAITRNLTKLAKLMILLSKNQMMKKYFRHQNFERETSKKQLPLDEEDTRRGNLNRKEEISKLTQSMLIILIILFSFVCSIT